MLSIVCVLVDLTKDGKIKRACTEGAREKAMLDELWKNFGTRVVVVAPGV